MGERHGKTRNSYAIVKFDIDLNTLIKYFVIINIYVMFTIIYINQQKVKTTTSSS